jgi:hypothetical protein
MCAENYLENREYDGLLINGFKKNENRLKYFFYWKNIKTISMRTKTNFSNLVLGIDCYIPPSYLISSFINCAIALELSSVFS